MTFAKGRSRPLLASLALAVAGLIAISMAACGGDKSSDSASETPASPAAQGLAGTITVTSSPITGQSGKILLILATAASGGPVARACVSIDSDRFSVPSTVMTDQPADDNPCGSPTAETIFSPGAYTVSAGIYQPPAQQPEKESTQTAQVTAGAPLQIALDGAALSR
jgi:hypothetical protein